MPNSLSNSLALIHIKRNIVIDLNLNNYYLNKIFFNNYTFLSNDYYHNNNFDDSSNSKSGISSIVPIKKYI